MGEELGFKEKVAAWLLGRWLKQFFGGIDMRDWKTTTVGILAGIAGVAAAISLSQGLPPQVTGAAMGIAAILKAFGFYQAQDK